MRTVHTHDRAHGSSVWKTLRVAVLEGLAWVKLQGKDCLGDQHGMRGGGGLSPNKAPPRSARALWGSQSAF